VGAVSGTDRPERAGSGTGEDLYVRYEMALRRAESRAGSLVGLSGCFFAVRREIANALLPEVPSDLGSALLSIALGKRAVAQDLAAGGYYVVLPWGNAAEQRRSDAIAGAVPNAKVPDLQPLDDAARMIARAAFVIGVDTGLLHLAAALGVPRAAIFVGTEPGQHGPLGAGKIEIAGGFGQMPSVSDVRAAVARIAP